MNRRAYPVVVIFAIVLTLYFGYKAVLFFDAIYDSYKWKMLTMDSAGSVSALLKSSGVSISESDVSLERLHDTYCYTVRESEVLSFQINRPTQSNINSALKGKKVDVRAFHDELDEIFNGLPASFRKDESRVSELFLVDIGSSQAIHSLAFTTDGKGFMVLYQN